MLENTNALYSTSDTHLNFNFDGVELERVFVQSFLITSFVITINFFLYVFPNL